MKKKLFMIWALASAGILPGFAMIQLKLQLADGSSPAYLLSEKPRITFNADDIIITTPEASVNHTRSMVERIIFEDSGAGVDAVSGDEVAPFSFINGTVSCQGSPIRIFDLSGALRASGISSLDTGTLPSGCYIAKTDFHTVKIFVK